MVPLAALPMPHDIPLPLPVDRVVLQGLIVLLFLLHIVFVNLMVGGSILCVACEMLGRRYPRLDALAREIAATITVNKSLAVVLGVGPLLAINVMYTLHFYSANALTGNAWIQIVPLVIVAFLLSYAHKYSWDRLGDRKRLHILLGAAAAVLFLCIPLIFLANINLMLFPERFGQVNGFFSAVILPNVLPRYLHFLLASLALTGLFLLLWLTRRGYPLETRLAGISRHDLRRGLYGVAFGATLLQFAAGTLVYFTLPTAGVSTLLTVIIVFGAALATAALVLMWWEISSANDRIGRLYLPVVGLLMCTGACMGYGRHLYREESLRPHLAAIEQHTTDFVWASAGARYRAASNLEQLPPGPRIYRDTCSTCHAIDRTVVGPPLTEIADLYRDDPAGIVRWTRNPGRKRPGVQPMPAFKLPEADLFAVAEHMLELGSGTPQSATPTTQPE